MGLRLQSEATQALIDGMAYAVRINGPNPCPWCADRQGQVLPIWDVINGIADHEFGQCSFLFLPDGDPLLDGKEKKTLVSGVEIFVIPVADDVLPDDGPDDSELDGGVSRGF